MESSAQQMATRQSWPNVQSLPDQRARLSLKRKFTQEEYELICQGLIPEAMEDKWFEQVVEHQGRDRYHFVICLLGDGRPIGATDLREINHFFNTALPQLEHRSLNGYLLDELGYEEPTLRQRFGAAYDEYARQVSRWIPRLPRKES